VSDSQEKENVKEKKPGLGDLSYNDKVLMLENIVIELQELVQEFAPVAGRYAELKAQVTVHKEIKSALQSALRAERSDGY